MEEQIKQLSVYLKDQISKGVSEDVLKGVSLGQGWNEGDFFKALALAKGQALPPTPSGAPVPPSPSGLSQNQSMVSFDSLMKNVKFMMTVKTIALYSAIAYVFIQIVGSLGQNIFLRYSLFRGLGIGSIVYVIVTGLVCGVLGGLIFYFFYDKIKGFIKTIPFVSTYLKNMFTFIWIPALVGEIISTAFAIIPLLGVSSSSMMRLIYGYSGVNPFSIITSILISSVVSLVAYFFYAKKVSEKLGSYYPW